MREQLRQALLRWFYVSIPLRPSLLRMLCPHTLLKSYNAGYFNLSMWFLVNDRAMITPRWLYNLGQQGTFHSGWWKLGTLNSKSGTGTSGQPILAEL